MNEAQAKQWIYDGFAWIGQGCSITSTYLDDKLVRMMMVAVSNDVIWSWVWPMIRSIFEGEAEPEVLLAAAADEEAPAEVTAAAAEVGLNPLMILAFVKAVMELIKMFRK